MYFFKAKKKYFLFFVNVKNTDFNNIILAKHSMWPVYSNLEKLG